ncbi:phospholipase effector Tle1 domain-containing protein [Paraburkholderia sp. A3BS-1L]|uniref:phospholipase effector Tle1 domain-containing protein n=1 Tax=Paraburkholderia sp. A3BS-1L TaxID=3028375 RepID=UPI003DA9D24A
MLGMGFGAGGDARIVFGLLHVLNVMHQSLDNYDTPMIERQTVQALCSNAWLSIQTGVEGGTPNTLSPADQRALDKVGMKDQGGLLTLNGHSHRTTFLKQQFAQLAQKIDEIPSPKLVEVFIDVFGFSRGAAEARVFCNWLDECCDGDTLAQVKTHIRFLGIFDTVAAVGLGPAASRWTNGHEAWGEAKNLRISPRVRHCEHYVAMHEQRESFPLEDVKTPGDELPPRCRQFRFPGMHSDLGGGYLPGEQGKNGGDDENKLARIPLNMMYLAAKAAKVPIDIRNATIRDGWDAFVIGEQLQSDYDAFIQANGNRNARYHRLPDRYSRVALRVPPCLRHAAVRAKRRLRRPE